MPTFGRPTSDVVSTGWLGDDNSTTGLSGRIDETPHSETDYIKRPFGGGAVEPPRVIAILLDDTRVDDGLAVMRSGPRAGQRVLEQTLTRVRDVGTNFLHAREDYSFCAPSRASMLTGQYATNHGLPNTSTQAYYQFCRGTSPRQNAVWTTGSNKAWMGPWEFDLALKAGLDEHSTVLASSVPITGRVSPLGPRTGSGRGDSTDDLQAFTGSLPTWLPDTVRKALIGKYQNGYGQLFDAPYDVEGPLTTRFVPPGWNYWFAVSAARYPWSGADVVGDDQDHYRMTTCEYAGLNDRAGNGVAGVNKGYQYDWQVASVVHNGVSGAGGRVTVTTVAALRDSDGNPPTVGDEVALDKVVGVTGYNRGVATLTAVNDAAKTYQFAEPTVLGAGTVVNDAGNPTNENTRLYWRKMFSEQIFGRKAIEFLESCDDTDPVFLYICSRMTHDSAVDLETGAADNVQQYTEVEKRYSNTVDGDTVDPNDAFWYDGVAGGISPAVTAANITSQRRVYWSHRQEMLASFDDWFGDVLDYADARWGHEGYVVIFVSDNGFQDGEHEDVEGSAAAWSPISAKTMVWEASERLPFWVRDPLLIAGDSYQAICTIDTPLAILDIFGRQDANLLNHHAHRNRDGRSWYRLLNDPSDPANQRAILVQGTYKGEARCPGIVSADGHKLVRSLANPSSRQMFNVFSDFAEQHDLAPGDPTTANALAARLDDGNPTAHNALMYARWDPVRQVNTCRTA